MTSDSFVRDRLPPPELLPEFLFDLPQPAGAPHRLQYIFSENVAASLAPADLLLENLTTAQTVSSVQALRKMNL